MRSMHPPMITLLALARLLLTSQNMAWGGSWSWPGQTPDDFSLFFCRTEWQDGEEPELAGQQKIFTSPAKDSSASTHRQTFLSPLSNTESLRKTFFPELHARTARMSRSGTNELEHWPAANEWSGPVLRVMSLSTRDFRIKKLESEWMKTWNMTQKPSEVPYAAQIDLIQNLDSAHLIAIIMACHFTEWFF